MPRRVMNEDSLKYEYDLQLEYNLKYECDFKYEEDLEYEDKSKFEVMHFQKGRRINYQEISWVFNCIQSS